ncbi:Uncharacterised protein [Rodentibacter pneumotropicus]|uniref:Uncharacterized protein n=1 Tax=Rodentibacter pneumotropicus TaxID=758 RepID=A0A448MQ51_9PAST|nr:Uncharacterised protein [Rodentibacter pneumotropicus]
MAVKPIYQEKLNQLGCCGSGSVGGKLSEQLAELQKKLKSNLSRLKNCKMPYLKRLINQA